MVDLVRSSAKLFTPPQSYLLLRKVIPLITSSNDSLLQSVSNNYSWVQLPAKFTGDKRAAHSQLFSYDMDLISSGDVSVVAETIFQVTPSSGMFVSSPILENTSI